MKVSELLKSNDSSCLSTSSLEKRTLSFSLGKKDGFANPTEFQYWKVIYWHPVQASLKLPGQLNAWLLLTQSQGQSLLLSEAVYFFLDRPETQITVSDMGLSFASMLLLFICPSFILWCLMKQILFFQMRTLPMFQYSSHISTNTFLFETKKPHFSNIPFRDMVLGSPCWSSWLRWSCKHEAPRPGHCIQDVG